MGRDAQAKASRKALAKDTDRALQQLLKRDKEGSRALASAREFGKKLASKARKGKAPAAKEKSRLDASRAMSDSDSETGEQDEDGDDAKTMRKTAYSAQLIRQLGFDPSAKEGKSSTSSVVKSKLDALAASQVSRRDIDLGPRRGKKSSCVKRPDVPGPTLLQNKKTADQSQPDGSVHLPRSDDESDLEVQEAAVFGRPVALLSSTSNTVNLDSSDTELEVEPPV
ncbi:uncharacterized protein FIBRA_05613 [Fibroporia radiculosa]|uniref:Uncharacterized protein n=1 Tax=Fibroporia radiculosa TaxID=599839 RepID=J4GRB9_9APHY|nr:uncharacterized protein FIBRA_05613 [Fibroporia radiculosa]CCM03480.1 predicted protein [Fibroporia radiculosa]